MFLKKLTVSSPIIGLIREIDFHLGVNLIIDKSVEKTSETGNSVGKTTALRAIDFCLGAKQDGFYIDPEFKTEDTVIKDFLINNEVLFTLDIVTSKGRVLVISRAITSTNKITAKIDDESFTSIKLFHHELKKVLFKNASETPSFRQIMTRFIRSSADKMSNALKTLTLGSNAQYETLNLFLFGFSDAGVLNERQQTTKLLKKIEKEYDVFASIRSKNSLMQSLLVIKRDIHEKEKEIESFSLGESYATQMQELNKIKVHVSQLSLDLSSLEMKRTLNEKAIETLEIQQDNTDPNELKKLYEEANIRVEELNKTFEQALAFHNKMLIKKIEFIKNNMMTLSTDIFNKKTELTCWLEKESAVLRDLSCMGSLSDLQLLQKDLNKLFESKGDFESSLELISEYEKKLTNANNKLEDISKKVEQHIAEFDKNLAVFNRFFATYTKELYNEEYILAYDISKGFYDFKIEPLGTINSKGNQGEGKKKAQVSALDLAYLSTLDENNSRTLRFVAHDGIEAIHINQIKILFDIASSINGQYILAILKDKLSAVDSSFVERNTVLELSESNKFFRL
ncbi:DUF2326 domain-containing protein [Escherichia marmotae]|nr:DUF2326 domain-containing protein [Escherichia marmotae]MED0603754.1 DUF2326 domain-containing protein [Escherichia marmotae]